MMAGQEQQTSGAGVARAHAQLLVDHRIQFQFSGSPEPPPPDWLPALAKLLRELLPFLRVSFWTLAILAGLAVVGLGGRWAWRYFRGGRPKRPLAGGLDLKAAGLRPPIERARALLEEADRLALGGRYREAAHVLLLRTIEDLQGRRPHAVRPALTTRDLAKLKEIPPPASQAFAVIANIVERSFFGAAELDGEDFAACRNAYEVFAGAESWAGAPQP